MQTGKAAGLRNQCLKVQLLLCAPLNSSRIEYKKLREWPLQRESLGKRNTLLRKWADGGTGRRTGLKILYQKWCVGSIPTLPTKALTTSV